MFLLLLLGCFVAVTAFFVKTYINSFKEKTLKENVVENQKEAEFVDSFIKQGAVILRGTARSVEALVKKGASQAQIESLLVSESDFYRRQEAMGFCHFVGLINGNLFNSGHWTPVMGYVPTSRPWYQDAIRVPGKVVLGATHLNPRSRDPVIAVSQSLLDGKVVLALDLYLKNMLVNLKSRGEYDSWMILDENGSVMVHADVTQQGMNYTLSRYFDRDEPELAAKILIANGEPFSYYSGEKKYEVFSESLNNSVLLQNRWYVIRMVDDESLWKPMKKTVAKIIAVSASLYLLLLILVMLYFWRYIRSTRTRLADSSFLLNLCWEIRSMTTDLLGMISIITNENRNDGLNDYLKNVRNIGQGTLDLVNNVLEVSKIESDKLNVMPGVYDLFMVLSDCFDANSPKAAMKNLRFSFKCDPNAPSSLWGTEIPLRQIINNLLSNAIKYTEEGEILLQVKVEEIAPEGTLNADTHVNLIISVEDTGIGIRTKDLNSVFKAYAKYSLENSQEGAGIGLALTKELVDKIGGTIMVKSQVGKGSKFEVSIPQLVVNSEPIGDFVFKYRTVSRNKSGYEMFLAPHARILIVDDAEMNLKVLKGFLKNTKVLIDFAVSGEQCLKLVQSKHYDLILLDYIMPKMNGIETFEKMKALGDYINKDTAVVILAAEELAKTNSCPAGVADYLYKPIKQKDLLKILKQYLPKQLKLTLEDLKNSDLETDVLTGTNAGYEYETEYSALEEEGEIELHPFTPLASAEKLSVFNEYVDVKVGLEYCDEDEELYLGLLRDYVESPLHESIDASFYSENWSNYALYVRMLCGASDSIGAMSMGDRLRNLERACYDGHYDYVRENHALAIALHAELIENIKKGLGLQ